MAKLRNKVVGDSWEVYTQTYLEKVEAKTRLSYEPQVYEYVHGKIRYLDYDIRDQDGQRFAVVEVKSGAIEDSEQIRAHVHLAKDSVSQTYILVTPDGTTAKFAHDPRVMGELRSSGVKELIEDGKVVYQNPAGQVSVIVERPENLPPLFEGLCEGKTADRAARDLRAVDTQERRQKRDLYVASRLSSLSYLPFDKAGAEGARAQADIRAGAKLYGFDQVDFVWDERTHTQALIAFSKEERQALIAFRGSQLDNLQDAQTNLSAQPHLEKLYGTASVHTGYHNAAAGIHGQIRDKLQALNQPQMSVCIAGHSQAGGEAQLEALWLARDGARRAEQDPYKGHDDYRVYSFGAPHVSDSPALAARYNDYGIDMTRVERSGDLVCGLNTLTPRDPYSNALGGRPPDEQPGARPRVGQLLYIQGDLTVRTNPPRHELLQDTDATLANNCSDVWGGICQAHLDYDKALFLNMDPKDQAQMSQRFTEARKEAGRDLWDAPPGSPRHEQAEAAWNAACREQQARIGAAWADKFDRRHEFHCHQQGPGPLNRAGSASMQVTIHGRFHDPATNINWFAEEPLFSEQAAGKKLFEQEKATGKGCLVPPEFGIDPREKVNYDHRAAEPGYALQLQSSLVSAAHPRKEGAEVAAVDVEINLHSVMNRQNVRVDFPPQIRNCPEDGSFMPAALAEEPKRAARSSDSPAHTVAAPGGSGM